MAPDKTLGVFGHAEFSARGPRTRFRAILMIFCGSKILETSPGQANYSELLLGPPGKAPRGYSTTSIQVHRSPPLDPPGKSFGPTGRTAGRARSNSWIIRTPLAGCSSPPPPTPTTVEGIYRATPGEPTAPRTPLDPGPPARGTGRDGIRRIGPGGRSGPTLLIPSRPVPRARDPTSRGSGGASSPLRAAH